MQKPTHVIQKQVIEVEMEAASDVFWFKNQLSEIFNDKLLPAIEAVFEEMDYNDKTLRLDHLEINVGTIASENWRDELVSLSLYKIKEALIQQSIILNEHDSETTTQLLQLNESTNLSDTFFYFLRTGSLPWYVSRGVVVKDILTALLKEEKGFTGLLEKFLKEAKEEHLVRLVNQFDEDLLDKLLRSIYKENADVTAIVDKKIDLKSYLLGIIKSRAALRKIMYLPLLKWRSLPHQTPVFQYFIHYCKEHIKCDTLEKDALLLKLKSLFNASETVRVEFIEKVIAEPVSKQPEEFFIGNAGLVLLHPFLPGYFKNVKLMNDQNAFIDEDAQIKAVLLTQYIITGESVFEEHELVLNKILCGLDIVKPVYNRLELTKEEEHEATDLLTQVTEQWKMNNTKVNSTIKGLRESFLQRPAKLTFLNKDWKLQVEQKAYDIVFNSLPWGFGIIRNSWMTSTLWVEWI